MGSKVDGIVRLASLLLLILPLGARADEELLPEELPPPKAVLQEATKPTPTFVPYLRASRYDIWQFHGTDRFGRFRPRVVLSPCGAYYLYDGRPYPWVTTHQMDFLLYTAD